MKVITFYFTSLFALPLPRWLYHTFFLCPPISKSLTPKFTLSQWHSFTLLWQNLSIRREPPQISSTTDTHLFPLPPICTHIICLPTWHHRYKLSVHLPESHSSFRDPTLTYFPKDITMAAFDFSTIYIIHSLSFSFPPLPLLFPPPFSPSLFLSSLI